MKSSPIQKSLIHTLFRISILIKGIDGILEILIGIGLFISSKNDNQLIQLLIQKELDTDPKDTISNFLFHFFQNVSVSTEHFIISYLVIHGIIKFGILLALWTERKWAFMVSGFLLSFFVIYQTLRFVHTHSLSLLLFISFDLLLLFFMWRDYVQKYKK